MTENNLNRFTYGSNERWEDVLIDNLEKKEYDLYSIDSLCNRLWEQTQRFEKHNQELVQRSITYEDKIDELKNENKKLKKEIRFIQSELHNASMDVRERTLAEVKDCIAKVERYE